VRRVRRIGVLMNLTEDDPEAREYLSAFVQSLQHLGWKVGDNLRIDVRWGAGSSERYRQDGADLVAMQPDVVLAANSSIVRALQQAGRTIPIVFAGGTDPVGGGLVDGLARPGNNTTGFSSFDFAMCTKWLEFMKQIAPSVSRVAVLRDPASPGQNGQFKAIEAAAPSLGLAIAPIDTDDAQKMESAITSFGQEPSRGLIAVSSASVARHRDLIIRLATRHRLPAVYAYRYFVAAGGLLAYGPDRVDPYRRAAGYVDRILKGERPANLPVQAPTKYELAINLKTARELSISIPPTLLATADEVIE